VTSMRLSIVHPSDLVNARRAIRELGQEQGFLVSAIEAMATAVTEIGRNMVVHGGGGELLLETVRTTVPPRHGIVATAIDGGPGIDDVELALADGYSTVGTLGLGLPSARRLVDEFEIQSTVGRGTTVTLRKWLFPDKVRAPDLGDLDGNPQLRRTRDVPNC
jgi:serine/threonine-protein kinase RsbT